MDIKCLCDIVRETSFDIHCFLRNGHLEKVYENALAHRLRKKGIDVRQQYPLQVYDQDGTLLGDYFADLFVDNRLIVELKACRTLADEHVAQILGYLKTSRIEHGVLINSGPQSYRLRSIFSARKQTVYRYSVRNFFCVFCEFLWLETFPP